ncbi:MAG: tetratricopeptide repeat protein [Thermoflexales bacterium]|nr:tetratricopeptide repeat protein [Thermoflexales bacterium]
MSGRLTLEGALIEAESALQAGNALQALAKTETLLVSFPDAVRVWRLHAQALEQQGEHARALEAYERVLAIAPTDLRAMTSAARMMQTIGRPQEASLIAQQVLDYLPTERGMLGLAPRPGLGDDAVVYRVALAQVRSGLPTRGLASLRALVEKHPARVDLRLSYARALWRTQEHIAACEQCWAVLSELPDCLVAHVLLFDIWRSACAVSLEQAHLAHVERLDPDHRETAALFELEAPLSVREVLVQRPNGVHPRPKTGFTEPTISLLADLLQATLQPPEPLTQTAPKDRLPEATDFIVGEWSRAEDLSAASGSAEARFVDVLSSEEGLSLSVPRVPITPEPGDDLTEQLEPLTWTPAGESPALASQPPRKPKSSARSARSTRAGAAKNPFEREVMSAEGAALDALIDRLERMAATEANAEIFEALGLAYTRRGNLEAALSAYQRALGKPR